MTDVIISADWDTGPRDIIADLEAVKKRLIEEASLPPDPEQFRMRFHPVSRARWNWLFENGYIDSQGNLTEKGGEALGRAIALRFELSELLEG